MRRIFRVRINTKAQQMVPVEQLVKEAKRLGWQKVNKSGDGIEAWYEDREWGEVRMDVYGPSQRVSLFYDEPEYSDEMKEVEMSKMVSPKAAMRELGLD